MARNVEIKARVDDLAVVEARASAISTAPGVDIFQDDTFFASAKGRLKLREFGDGRGELIYYLRPDGTGPKVSEYLISPTTAPDALRESLACAVGVVGRVKKHRRLYLLDRTRIHLDQVDGLGAFVELEVMLLDDESLESGEAVAREVMGRLGIGVGQLVEGAYVDLLRKA